MLSNRVKRNIWLTLTIMSGLTVIDRAVRIVDGSVEWWNLLSSIIKQHYAQSSIYVIESRLNVAISLAESKYSDDTDRQM